MTNTIPKITTKKLKNKYFGVRYKGKIAMYLNEKMARDRGLSFDDLKFIKKIHRRRLKLFDDLQKEDNPNKLQILASKITDIEYDLQDGWKYERNEDFHSWWFRLPKCTCPTMDNWDYFGTGLGVMTENCPLHSTIDAKNEN